MRSYLLIFSALFFRRDIIKRTSRAINVENAVQSAVVINRIFVSKCDVTARRKWTWKVGKDLKSIKQWRSYYRVSNAKFIYHLLLTEVIVYICDDIPIHVKFSMFEIDNKILWITDMKIKLLFIEYYIKICVKIACDVSICYYISICTHIRYIKNMEKLNKKFFWNDNYILETINNKN